MTRHRMVVVTVIGLAAVAVWPAISLSESDRAGREKIASLAEAADTAFKATRVEYDAGLARVEDVYQWSLRLMETEQLEGKANAAADHADRMRELHKRVAALHRTGGRGGSSRDFYSTQYYSLEADSQLTTKQN